jgi:hypothetical protein
MKSQKYILYIIVLLLFGTHSCQNDDDNNNEEMESVQKEIESFMALNVDGQGYDTLFFDCFDTYFNIINNVVWVDNGTPNFILRQGFRYELENDFTLTSMVYIFDSTAYFQLYSPQVMADYINNKKANTSLDIEIVKNGVTYRNQWFTDWHIDEFTERLIVDEFAEYSIITNNSISPSCTENLPLLPVDIHYNGILKTADGLDSIKIDSMSSRLYLIEVF